MGSFKDFVLNESGLKRFIISFQNKDTGSKGEIPVRALDVENAKEVFAKKHFQTKKDHDNTKILKVELAKEQLK